MEEDINNAVEVLRKGGIILYPTDTVWGIGCDASNSDAVDRIYKIKKRSDNKSMLVLVSDESMLERCVEDVPEIAFSLIDVSIKPLTIIYDKAIGMAHNLISEDGSVGVRITTERFSRELCRRFRKPIVSTSANISGVKTSGLFVDIPEEIMKEVDYIVTYRQDDKTLSSPSSIIKLGNGGTVKIIRD